MKLSLVVAAPAGHDGGDFFRGLSVNRALETEGVEVLMVCARLASLGAPPQGVQVLSPEGPSIFELWGTGVRRATGRYIALLDIRCPLEPGWIATVLGATEGAAPAYFGPVACAWSPADPQALGYLVEYVQFHAPLSPSLQETPGVNVAVARELAQDPEVLRRDGFVKTRLLRLIDMRSMAAPLPLPEAIVRYRKRYRWGEYLAHRYGHGRCYAARRPFSGPLGKLAGVLATPLLPLVRSWRIWRHARRTPYATAFWRLLPQILVAETAWSLGELSGYLLGAGGWRAGLK